jgi:hypothetical protein
VIIWMLHMFHTYVASVLFGCCICLQLFFKCFSCVFACVARCIFRMFQLFRMYMASVLFGCFKNRSRVLCMLQCETLTVTACYSCWGVVHGGERHNRCGGAWEAGKHGEWRGQAPLACACNRRWRGRCSRRWHLDARGGVRTSRR